MKKLKNMFLILAASVLMLAGATTLWADSYKTDPEDGTIHVTKDDGTTFMIFTSGDMAGEARITGVKEGQKSVTLPSEVTVDGKTYPVTQSDSIFWKDQTIEEVIIPDSYTFLTGEMFLNCKNLKKVTLPNNLYMLDRSTFEGCVSLKSIEFPSGLKIIGSYSFLGCTGLTEITIPSGVETVSYFAFIGCNNLKTVTMPDTLTEVETHAFWQVPNLKEVTIPASVTKIGDYAFGFVGEEEEEVLVPGFTIKGYSGSAAQKYASDNGIPFVALDGNNETNKETSKETNAAAPAASSPAPVVVQEPITIPNKPAALKVKVKKNKATVSWRKIKKNKKGKALLKQISSIQIQYSTDPNFQTNVATKSAGKNKTKISLKLQKKTVYYIRIRYVGNGGVSAWTGVKRVKTK